MRTFSMMALLTILIISCKKESKNDIDDGTLEIKYGTFNGWCSMDDSLTISDNDLSYVTFSPCDTNIRIIKQALLSESDKLELVNTLNMSEFKKIESNSCNICVDGTDYWISVKNDSYYHKIRYGYMDTALTSKITPFIKLLDKHIAKFRQ